MMRKMNFNEVRKIQLDMLDVFIDYCSENNLRYYLDAGTLLGAIRHKGFIPWDDDIDVCMPRRDYEKLLLLAKDGISGDVELLFPEDSIYPMLKIINKNTLMIEFPNSIKNEIGVYIDVFPKDGVSNKNCIAYFQCFLIKCLVLLNWFFKVSIYKWKSDGNMLKRSIAFLVRLLLGNRCVKFPLKLIDKLAKLYSFDDSKRVATVIAGGMKNCVDKSKFDDFDLAPFEHLSAKVPIGHNDYLRQLYGEYMIVPPIEERLTHDNVVYFLDENDMSNIK